MKNQILILLCVVLASITITSCENQSTKDNNTPEVEGMVEAEVPPVEQDEIQTAVAIKRIKAYNDVYGSVNAKNPQGEGIYNFLGKAGDPDGSVMAPRYFTINRESFSELVNYAKSNDKSIYASFGVTSKGFTGPSSRHLSIADLIFHFVKPNPDGSLNDIGNDKFYDHAQPCPVDCGPIQGETQGGEITGELAQKRIDDYNKIYNFGNDGNNAHYLKGTVEGEQKTILMPRYYKFNEIDLVQLLGDQDNDKYLYISIGAEQDKNDPNTYTSDLIFHHIRPNSQGYVIQNQPATEELVEVAAEGEEKEDEYYDVTVPCPDVCED